LVPVGIVSPHVIEESLLRTMRLARLACVDLLPEDQDATGIVIKNILEAKKQILCAIDPSFQVEYAFFVSLVGESGEARLRTLVLEALGSNDKPKTIDASYDELVDLQKSKLYDFVGVAVQTVFGKVKEWVAL
jgi:hypothetical protein